MQEKYCDDGNYQIVVGFPVFFFLSLMGICVDCLGFYFFI